jgi:hypothetical protein
VKGRHVNVRSKTANKQGEHAIFGDEEAAALHAEVATLRDLVSELADRVHAQFTTISAHAEIARQQVEFTRDEARADLERTRELMIDLIDQTRRELTPARSGTTVFPAPSSAPVAGTRIDVIEERLESIAVSLDRCFDRQRELADTMAALLDTVLGVSSEPVRGLAIA